MTACLLRALGASSTNFVAGCNRLALASSTSSRPLLTLRRSGQRAFHVSAVMGEDARRYQSAAPSEPLSRVFVDHTIYKKQGALKFSPVAPKFKVNQTGSGYGLAREGSLFLTFSPSIGTRKYDWNKKQIFSLSVSEIGSVLGLNAEDKLEFYHDPFKGKSGEGRVQKILRVSPFNDYNGFFFSLSVKDNLKGIDERINVAVDKAEFIVVRNAMNFVLPYLMGWHVFTNPSTMDPSMLLPSAPSTENTWQ